MNRWNRFAGCLITVTLCTMTRVSMAHEMYHLVLVPNPDGNTLNEMERLGLPLDDARDAYLGLELPLEVSDIDRLEQSGIYYQLVELDLAAANTKRCVENLANLPPRSQQDPANMKYGSMGGFYNFDEIIADLDLMHALYPSICAQKVAIGYSWDKNPIYMVKISDNPEVDEDEPEVLLDALHHAREPASYTSMIYAMWNLLEKYGTDKEVTYLVDNRELYFVPVVNPDGLLYNISNHPKGGGMWRKNRRDNGKGLFGVDLNRNYTYQWGYDDAGSSGIPSTETYRGPKAGSEPETQTMMAFIGKHTFVTAMTVHSFSGKFITAYGYDAVNPEFYDVHMDYLEAAAANNDYDFGPTHELMYASNGRTQDWQLQEHGIINVEPEVGFTDFWPPIKEIFLDARDIQACYTNQFWCAGGHVVFGSASVLDGYLVAGESREVEVTVFNRGFGTSEPVTFGVSSTFPGITVSSTPTKTSPIPRREEAAEVHTMTVTVASDFGDSPESEFVITINQGGFGRRSIFKLPVGEPGTPDGGVDSGTDTDTDTETGTDSESDTVTDTNTETGSDTDTDTDSETDTDTEGEDSSGSSDSCGCQTVGRKAWRGPIYSILERVF